MRFLPLLLALLPGCVPDADEGWEPVGPLLVPHDDDQPPTDTGDTGDTGMPAGRQAAAPEPPAAVP